jgi:hypothetical protein
MDASYLTDELVPGERIGPPRAGVRGKALLRGGIFLLLAGGGAWLYMSDPATWPAWLPKELAAVARWLDSGPRAEPPRTLAAAAPTRPEPAAKPVPLPAPPALPAPSASQAPLPVAVAAKPEPPPLTTASLPPAAAGDAPGQPLAPATVDPSDPYQVRAAAVGLHPELSPVLLARLSPTDYRNAGIAIQTAIAETPDNAVFVWPRQRKPELALFRVRFVAGAAPGCRRYVVTVVKDGWLTTALPMEKCNAEASPARATLSKRAEKRL